LNILVTGSNGQLGSEIQELSSEYAYNFFFTDRNNLDITDVNAVREFVEKNAINAVINCAAYTAVDKAETDEVNANAVNHLAVKNLALIAKEKNIILIHVSTDYVFDGKNFKPYTEDDNTNPNGVYGKTKLDGENAIIEINPLNAVIIRTSWVYSSYGANFVKTMLRLGKEKESLGVIYDQVGTPTYARDLAKAIMQILDCRASLAVTESENITVTEGCHCEERSNLSVPEASSLQGTEVSSLQGTKQSTNVQIYNYSNEGVLSWYDFAKEIMRMAKLDCVINPIETIEYPTPAQRPHYSLLNKSKIKKEFGIIIPDWKDSLDECLKKMGERK
jgi:dTDP-4-dehydrorhamnose reductase